MGLFDKFKKPTEETVGDTVAENVVQPMIKPIGTAEIKLTQTEYNILAYLSEHTGKVLTYSVIISNIWGRMDEGSIKKLQVNMANIRKKLGVTPGDTRYIINELGVGYRMQDPILDDDNP